VKYQSLVKPSKVPPATLTPESKPSFLLDNRTIDYRLCLSSGIEAHGKIVIAGEQCCRDPKNIIVGTLQCVVA
jgi:hypothetical protein